MNRDDVRRLQKAARDKNIDKLKEWSEQYQYSVEARYEKYYQEVFSKEVNNAVETLMLALAYTLCFSEEINMDKKNIGDFINDFVVTVDMFRTGEYKPSDYEQALLEYRSINRWKL